MLGKDYDLLDITITADPHARDPASRKCTMPHPHANRHLRHVTGLAALSKPEGAEAASSVRAGSKPSGGKLRVQIQAEGIATYTVPPAAPGDRTPIMTVTVAGQDLHATLVERILELPMDIHEGRVSCSRGGEGAVHDACGGRGRCARAASLRCKAPRRTTHPDTRAHALLIAGQWRAAHPLPRWRQLEVCIVICAGTLLSTFGTPLTTSWMPRWTCCLSARACTCTTPRAALVQCP